MSIRKKFSAAIIIIFLLNIALLLGFYRISVYPSITKQMNEIKSDIEKTIEENVTDIKDKNKTIEVFNQNINKNNIRKYSAKSLIESLIFVELIIMCIILIIASIIIYIYFVKPIEMLSKEMDNYSKGIAIKNIKNRKDEIGRLYKDFINLVNKVEDEKKKQNNIVASISHDIKTPLTSIMGYSERLMKKDISIEKQKVYLSTIYSKSQTINELINDFDEYLNYNFSKQLLLKTYTLDKVEEILQSEYSYELEDMGVDFKVINSCKDKKIALDINKFKRVIGNIISNSIKFTSGKERKISINIEEDKVKEKDRNLIKFTISDSGTGVDETIINNIFEPLFTTDKSRKVAGLGLSICKNIITAHDGEIIARNGQNGGLEIQISVNEIIN